MSRKFSFIKFRCRLWDVRTCDVVREISLPGSVLSIELSKDISTITVSHSNGVTFLDATRYGNNKMMMLKIHCMTTVMLFLW